MVNKTSIFKTKMIGNNAELTAAAFDVYLSHSLYSHFSFANYGFFPFWPKE